MYYKLTPLPGLSLNRRDHSPKHFKICGAGYNQSGFHLQDMRQLKVQKYYGVKVRTPLIPIKKAEFGFRYRKRIMQSVDVRRGHSFVEGSFLYVTGWWPDMHPILLMLEYFHILRIGWDRLEHGEKVSWQLPFPERLQHRPWDDPLSHWHGRNRNCCHRDHGADKYYIQSTINKKGLQGVFPVLRDKFIDIRSRGHSSHKFSGKIRHVWGSFL